MTRIVADELFMILYMRKNDFIKRSNITKERSKNVTRLFV